ncbi:hypothetical protein PHIM7_169 [Sinorhizobium phage phiM7]|uniref:Uncharacterized protein n=2 Tax=Emdodecavirus TaxID=1980937 RepID=S5MVD3_9CAUD|nr:hypothetical protein AB690_gp330 [Sinorhizobium phage phiM12]YP_009601294.1 hypothetical protein FDH46_gp309 [Sinorhizobium phage phiM7]AGR47872.1 hypothetical protein SmphiM12_240 [Sinorhizobium phage phiM12]AKF12714.1 hypothetical protein PHIM7_169 [Sinorhizobium phage phiM7]AKF13074.1 hypothetical protein PHIM19_169 [Sinorhizobium phage phiM19]
MDIEKYMKIWDERRAYIPVPATKNPDVIYDIEFTEKYIKDLVAIFGTRAIDEFSSLLQEEADLRYAIEYEGYVQPKVEHKTIETGGYLLEINPVGENGLSINVTKKVQ